MRISAILIFCGLLTFAISCLDPFYPGIDEYLDLPVVEGYISDSPGPYTVRLSRTVAMEDPEIKPIRNAVVIIADDTGLEETLTETAPGVYITHADGMRGVKGKSYSVIVKTDGKTYQSAFETIPEAVAIDSVYAHTETRYIEDGAVQGLQFYVNTKALPDQHAYLLWKYEETYKFRAELVLDFIYYSLDSIVRNLSDSGQMCWRTVQSYEAFTFSSVNYSQPQLSLFPIHFVDGQTNKLSVRYSVLVNQYTVSERAYHYWDEIGRMNEESGSLYTRQPYQIKGNLYNVENSDEVILGYFMAAGISNKRIYVNPPSIGFNFGVCTPATDVLINSSPDEINWPLYAMLLPTGEHGFAHLACFDCRMNSGTETAPDFWQEFTTNDQ
ncbi:MAG: DUF4249 domain-containing protein [Bacteroidales bacterium]|nr:DUF4249 domain-containing protein [Bacteroidales bacterium]